MKIVPTISTLYLALEGHLQLRQIISMLDQRVCMFRRSEGEKATIVRGVLSRDRGVYAPTWQSLQKDVSLYRMGPSMRHATYMITAAPSWVGNKRMSSSVSHFALGPLPSESFTIIASSKKASTYRGDVDWKASVRHPSGKRKEVMAQRPQIRENLGGRRVYEGEKEEQQRRG